MLAHMGQSRPALKTDTTGQVRFCRNIVVDLDKGHLASDRYHMAAQLMADDAGRVNPSSCPFVPTIDMGIGSTERGRRHLDHGIVWPWSWVCPISQRKAWSRNSFDERLHACILPQLARLDTHSSKNKRVAWFPPAR